MVFEMRNNSACYELEPGAFYACNATICACEGTSEEIAKAIMPIVVSLGGLGVLYTLHGAVKLADLGVKAVFCSNRVERDNSLILSQAILEETIQQENCLSRWKKCVKVWNRIFKTGRTIGFASLCFSTAVPSYKFGQAIQSACANANCHHFTADTINTCNWANDWLIDVIKEILKGCDLA